MDIVPLAVESQPFWHPFIRVMEWEMPEGNGARTSTTAAAGTEDTTTIAVAVANDVSCNCDLIGSKTVYVYIWLSS